MKHFAFISLLVFLQLGVASASDDFKSKYPFYAKSAKTHQMKVLHSGIAALEARLRMIETAEESIEMEYFIFNANPSVRLLMQAVKERKKERPNLKVRILIDKSAAVFSFDEFYAKFLKKVGIQVRYYNAASIFQISTVQFRNHRKLFVVDGREAITGGRNLDDDYFDLSHHYNFNDRDIWVKGEIVTAMEKSFDQYWQAGITERPSNPKRPVLIKRYNKKDQERLDRNYRENLIRYRNRYYAAKKLLKESDEDRELLAKARGLGSIKLDELNTYLCKDVTFATDLPGGNFKTRLESNNYKETFRILRQTIMERVLAVDEKIFIDSPYLLLSPRTRKALNFLLDNKKQVSAYTNSLGSTDAVYVASVFNPEVKKWTGKEGFNVYLHRGAALPGTETIDEEIKKAVWGTHSKTLVFDDDEVMVGTFNIDNRSSFYNSEMALFCNGNKALARDVLDNIEQRTNAGVHLGKDGRPDDGTDLLANSGTFKKMIYHLLKGPAWILQFLL
ncbi:MAG: phospholipase [Halobacteriovoraceae bacterium]|jgi:cardiolipin synthase C|nr:phospholipase [Halobacteriovoraceae bacterium]MBT5095193.1 phospholipase [Halobacteriovoraceae bacterium]